METDSPADDGASISETDETRDNPAANNPALWDAQEVDPETNPDEMMS